MTYITRAGWGARGYRDRAFIATPAPLLVLHHAAAGGFGASAVRGHQNYHLDVRRWDDIAYTALADDTNIYEGRGWGIRTAATGPVNDRSQAVCALGNWSVKTPPDGLLDQLAFAAVLAFQAGAVDQPAYDGGHRDYQTRDCPGDRLYAKIGEINRRAALLADPTKEDDMPTADEVAAAVWAAGFGRGDSRVTAGQRLAQAATYSRIAATKAGTVEVDAAVLADSIVDAMPASLARQVADELYRRLEA